MWKPVFLTRGEFKNKLARAARRKKYVPAESHDGAIRGTAKMSHRLKSGRRLHSNAEIAVANQLTNDGWEVLGDGWPDFLCLRGDEIQFIEVKSHGDRLRPAQARLLTILRNLGLTVRCVRPRANVPGIRLVGDEPVA